MVFGIYLTYKYAREALDDAIQHTDDEAKLNLLNNGNNDINHHHGNISELEVV
jgi:hypothetical protein